MISYTLILIGSYSVALAVIIGLVRFRRINRAYYPFLFVTILTLVNEVLNPIMIDHFSSNAVNTNLLALVTTILWLEQFKAWRPRGSVSKWQYGLLLCISAGAWITENLVLGRITGFRTVFPLMASFMLVFLAINQINRLILEEKANLFHNSRFLICTGVIIYHTYKIMVDSFYVMELNESNEFLSNIFMILVFVNLFVNLLFALATLWIPTRQRFTMQY